MIFWYYQWKKLINSYMFKQQTNLRRKFILITVLYDITLPTAYLRSAQLICNMWATSLNWFPSKEKIEKSRPVGCGSKDEQQKYIFSLDCYFQCYFLKNRHELSQLLLLDDSLLPYSGRKKSHNSTGLFFPNPSPRTERSLSNMKIYIKAVSYIVPHHDIIFQELNQQICH